MATLQSDLLSQQTKKQIFTKGATVYRCDVCNRKTRVPLNKFSFDVVQRCVITKGCLGKLHRVLVNKEINDTPSIAPSIPGLNDWSQRRVFFEFIQSIESDVWTVVHNLTNKPNVQVFVFQIVDGEEVLVEIDPVSITTIDLNTTQIQFSRAYKGQAECIATASANTTNPNVGEPTIIVQETTLLTNAGELTIATLDDAPLITFTVRYKTGTEPGFIDIEYVGVDDQPTVLSPWVGVEKIYVNGKTFTVRSFNIRTHPLAPIFFSSQLIADGSQLFFSSLSTTPGTNLILLGTSPFNPVDRVLDRYVDIAVIDTDQPELVYANGEMFTGPSVIKLTYPLIFLVD